MRSRIALLNALLVLALVNFGIAGRERLLTEGRVVLLELVPVDPRSLMQGDYMALRFEVANPILQQAGQRQPGDGHAILRLDGRGIGHFERLDDGTPPAPDQARMRYRVRDGQVKLATNAFFFQEGHAHYYRSALYGEFRVAPDGEAILTGLRDPNLRVLGPPDRPGPAPRRKAFPPISWQTGSSDWKRRGWSRKRRIATNLCAINTS